MKAVQIIFRIDIGYDPERGYAAVVTRAVDGKQKGIKGNSIRQLMRRVHEEVALEDNRRRDFPLENEPKIIISPEYDGV